MKLTRSGVIFDAAQTRSPSFSRSSSSATMTSLPLRISSMASSTRSNDILVLFRAQSGACASKVVYDESSQHITLEIHPVAHCEGGQVGRVPRVWNQRDFRCVCFRHGIHRQAHAVNGDGTMQNRDFSDLVGQTNLQKHMLTHPLDPI